MSAQLTPGPWAIIKCSCGDASCSRYGLSVGVFPQGSGFRLDDARLAAAAPDLLALARQYAAECGECNGKGTKAVYDEGGWFLHDDPCPDCIEIRTVIAKATTT